jgi:hypothetical protein
MNDGAIEALPQVTDEELYSDAAIFVGNDFFEVLVTFLHREPSTPSYQNLKEKIQILSTTP